MLAQTKNIFTVETMKIDNATLSGGAPIQR